jgi:anaerobic ribonucleoside-triphosphate reductase activating protein
MEIRIFGTVEDSIVDGPGLRYSVFVQGCPHHCPGCHNPESHDSDGGKIADTAELIRPMQRNPLLDGLTLSGGEPMCQPEGCRVLAQAAHEARMNVWCYTGYTWEMLRQENDPARMALLNEVDVLVDGPFLLEQRNLDLRFRGSENQRCIDLNATRRSGETVLLPW